MSFIFVMKRLMITKNSVKETQNPIVNHESQPVKLNPVMGVVRGWGLKKFQYKWVGKA